MKKIFSTIIITCYSLFHLSAQDTLSAKKHHPLLYNYTTSTVNTIFNEDLRDSARFRFSVIGDYAANSAAAPASLGYGILFRQNISRAVIDRTDKRIKDYLRFEDNLKAGATFSAYLTKPDITLFFSYYHRQMRNVRAPKEAFQTIFYGNARFAGESADFSNLRVYNYIYNDYSFGVKKKIDYGSYQMEFGVGLSFLQMINQQEIRTNEAAFYTAEDGDTLRINYDLTFNTAKEGAVKYGDLNGIGGAGTFHLAVMNKDKWKIALDVTDLGYVHMRKNPTNYSGSNTVEFRGIVIPDLLNFNSQTFDTLNVADTIRAKLPSKNDDEYGVFMPFSASLVFSKPLLNNRLVLSAGLQYRFLPQYYVYGYAKVNYFIKPDMIFSASAGAGGYSLFNLGAEFAKSWKYFDFAVGSANLLGLILPSHHTGMGLYVRMGTSF